MLHDEPDDTRDDENLAPAGYVRCEYDTACTNLTTSVVFRGGDWVPTCGHCARENDLVLFKMNLDAGRALFEQFAREQRADDWPL